MVTDIGALSLGILPQFAALDALEARLAVLDRQPHIVTIGVDTAQMAAAETKVASLGTAHQALGTKSVALGMDVSQIEGARNSVKNLDNDLLSLVGSAGKVSAALAAPVAFGALTKFAADYQTTLTETANQTTLAADGIALMDKSIRDLPSGDAPLKDLATGFKNITDLGYSAADATKIAAYESKAATETGANQATVMLAITSAMKEYNAQADQVGTYTNIVAQAAKEANSSLQAWTEGTRTGVAVAAAYGVSLQEADAFMVALTRHGFDAAESATQLRGVIQHIVNPDAAAQANLQAITKATGIDLVSDFSDEGLKARGFANVMADLQAVIDKTGDESIVTKLIPALRGGQGALITVTQAAGDAKQALTDLNAAADGSLKPVDEGFARIQQTAGYQFGQTMKELKLDLIDVGQAGLPPITALAEAFGKVPAPVIEGAVRIGELLLVLKGLSVAGDLLSGMWERIATSTAASTAASATEATAATDAAATTTALTAALAANTAATIANTEARVGNAVSAADMIAGVPGFTLALADENTTLTANTAITNENTLAKERNATAGAGSAAGAGTAAAGGAGILGRVLGGVAPLIGIAEGFNTYPKVIGDLASGDFKQAFGDFLRTMPATPQGLASTIGNLFGVDIYQWLYDHTGIGFGGNSSPTATMPTAGATAAIMPGGYSPYDQPGAAARGGGATPGVDIIAQQKASDEYAKQRLADLAAAQKQAQQDATKSAQEAIQRAGDAEVASAQKVEAAWKQAGSAVASVDPSKGIQGLIDAAPKLTETNVALDALGQHSAALSDLTNLSEMFHAWGADVDKATAALAGYNLTLAQTNQAIKDVGALQSQYIAALDAAEKRVAAGTADQSDRAIINARGGALSSFANQTSRLQQQGNLDILGQLQNLPDYAGLNQNLRALVAGQGGGAGILAQITADKDKASQDIQGFQAVYSASITKIKQDTQDAKNAVGDFLAHLPADQTITIRYVLPDGTPVSTTVSGQAQQVGPPVPTGLGGAQYGPPLPPGYGGGGGLAFQPLSSDQYSQIVTTGPLANPTAYAGIMAAAQQANVDPRALLAFIRNENVDPALAAVNNFGGIKGSGGPPAPANEGGTYAAYSSPQAFFQALAANLTTGDYANDYQSGNLAAVRQRYVAGSGTPSAAQQQNIAGTVDYYNQLTQQFPAASVTAPPVPAAANSRVSLTMPTPDPGLGASVNVAAMRQRAQELAGSAYTYGGGHSAGDAGGFDCSGYVMEVMRAGGISVPWTDAGGLYQWAQTDAGQRALNAAGIELGFFNPGAGGMNEHVAINLGGQWFEDGGMRGDSAGPSPNAAQGLNAFVGTARASGSNPLLTGALTAAANLPTVSAGREAGGASAPGAAHEGLHAATVSAGDLQRALQAVNAEFAKMDAPAIKAAKDSLTAMLPTLTEIAGKALFGPNGPLTDTEKQEAAAAAWQKGLNYEKDFATVVQGITAGTISLDQATQRLAADIGGPLAQAYGQMGAAQAQIAAADSRIASLQADQKTADAAHQDALKVIQGGQEAIAAAHQTATDRIAAETTAENLKYQNIQRGEQDKQRALQFSQQLEATDLQNQLVDLQTRQQRSGFNRTAQEQNANASVLNANTNQAAAPLSAALAAMHERDLAQKDADTQAVDALQTRIRLEARQAAVDSYNLQTETINSQRAHENRMNGIAGETTAENLRYQKGQADIKAATDAENVKYQGEKDANAAAIDAQNTIKTAAQGNIDLANQAILAWQQTGLVILGVGQRLATAAAGGSVSTGFLTAQSLTNFPNTGAIRHLAAGGSFMGSAIVGDTAAGGLTPYSELVIAPHGATVVPLHGVKPQGGGDVVNLNLGDVALMLSESDKAEIRAFVAAKIDAVRIAGRTQMRSTGRG